MLQVHLGTILWGPLTDWKPIRDEVVKAALEILLDVRNHPVLLIDPYDSSLPLSTWCKSLIAVAAWAYIRRAA